MLVSPAEDAPLRSLGQSSSEPEKYGADFLWLVPKVGLCGTQRKRVDDLVASLRDGRLAKELGQMAQLARAVLIIEGDWRWLPHGQSATIRYGKFFRKQYRGLVMSIQAMGVWVVETLNMEDTAEALRQLEDHFQPGPPSSLLRRPNAKGKWGAADSEEWGCHWWMTFEGIGPTQAKRLYAALGIPVIWTCTLKDLMAVEGIGKVRATRMLASLGGTNGTGGSQTPDHGVSSMRAASNGDASAVERTSTC